MSRDWCVCDRGSQLHLSGDFSTAPSIVPLTLVHWLSFSFPSSFPETPVDVFARENGDRRDIHIIEWA